MSLVLAGDCLGVREEAVERGGQSWIETSIVVLDGYTTAFARVVKDFQGELPKQGDKVAIRVGVRCYKKRDGSAAYAYTAFGREPAIERLLNTPPAVKAV